MKKLLNHIKISALSLSLLVLGSTAFAQDSERLDVVGQLQNKVEQLEFELLDLKTVDTRSMTKAEKKRHRLEKKTVRRELAHYSNQLARLTSPGFAAGPYTGFYNGFYDPFWDPFWARRYYVPRRVVVRHCPPAPAVRRTAPMRAPAVRRAPRN